MSPGRISISTAPQLYHIHSGTKTPQKSIRQKQREWEVSHGKGYTVLDQPLLVLTVERSVVCDVFQPSDPVKEVRIVLEISDVHRDLRGRGIKFIHARPMDHIPQLNRAEISLRRLDDTSGVNQGSKKRCEGHVTAAARRGRISQNSVFQIVGYYSQTSPV